MDDQERRERLEIIIQYRTTSNERVEANRILSMEKRMELLQQRALQQELRRRELRELERLRREMAEEAQQMRRMVQQARLERLKLFCRRVAEHNAALYGNGHETSKEQVREQGMYQKDENGEE